MKEETNSNELDFLHQRNAFQFESLRLIGEQMPFAEKDRDRIFTKGNYVCFLAEG